jgi:hypothetical protein
VHRGYTQLPNSAPEFAIERDIGNEGLVLRTKIRDCVQDFSSFIAEVDETASIFTTVIEFILDAHFCLHHPGHKRCYRRFVFKRPPLTWKTLAGANLTNNFVIQPTASDLYNVAQQFNLRLPEVRRFNQTFKYNERKHFPNGNVQDVTQKIIYSVNVKLKGGTPPYQTGNPIEWAWERVPFSFVVDWMLPIGSYIASFGALTSVERVDGTVSTRTDAVQLNKVLNPPNQLTYVRYGSYELRNHVREMIDSIPYAGFPSAKFSSSFRALGNAISLLYSLRHK